MINGIKAKAASRANGFYAKDFAFLGRVANYAKKYKRRSARRKQKNAASKFLCHFTQKNKSGSLSQQC